MRAGNSGQQTVPVIVKADTAERNQVREALMELKEPSREVIVLREYDGRSYEEIAEIVGSNEAAVRKRYSRALAELGRALKKKGL